METMHDLIHETAFAIEQGHLEEAKKLLSGMDALAHQAIHGNRQPTESVYTDTPPYWKLPGLWKIGDHVRVQFPGNGEIGYGKVVKVAFTPSYEPLYDVEVPFEMNDAVVHTRIHGIREWHLRNPDDAVVKCFIKANS